MPKKTNVRKVTPHWIFVTYGKKGKYQEGYTKAVIRHMHQNLQILESCHSSHAPKFTNIRKVTPYWIFVTCTKKQLLATGRPPGEGQLSATIGLLRKVLSTANISVLLNRSSMIGEGAKLSRGRREWTKLEERKIRDERQAAWRADTTGKAVIRKGHFWLG